MNRLLPGFRTGKPEPVHPVAPVDLLGQPDPLGLAGLRDLVDLPGQADMAADTVGMADDKSNPHPVQISSSKTTHCSPPAKNLIQFTQKSKCVEHDEGTGVRLRMRRERQTVASWFEQPNWRLQDHL